MCSVIKNPADANPRVNAAFKGKQCAYFSLHPSNDPKSNLLNFYFIGPEGYNCCGDLSGDQMGW